MNAEILAVGTELLMGEILDTNSSYLATRLPPLGIRLRWVTQVEDNLEMLSEALHRAMERSELVLTIGGLGPTQDDLTRESIARTLGEELEVREELVRVMEEYFQRRGMAMSQANVKQATLIPSARALPNTRGTAPGWWVEKNGRIIIAMPGPPNELKELWEKQVVPKLQDRVTGEVIVTRTLKTTGLSEAVVEEMVARYEGKENPYLGIYAKPDGIHLRIIARAPSQELAQHLIRPVEEGIRGMLESSIWGVDEETPEESVAALLRQRGLTLATMESCTAGLLASTVTDVADSSPYFKGGLVTYTAEAMVAAGVEPALIQQHGTVSPEVARAMAQAARQQLKADVGTGVTGVAGPASIEGKMIGTVFIAIALGEESYSFPQRFPPQRHLVKHRAVATALIELAKLLKTL